MNFLDIRTIMSGQLITNALCTLVLTILWVQYRNRYAGLHFWAIDFLCQTTSTLFIVLRGGIPDWISIGFMTPLIVIGALFGYLGLRQFFGKRGSQRYNFFILGVFILIHLYFSFIQPDVNVRNLNVSLGVIVLCGQCVWLLLRQTGIHRNRITRVVGWIFALICLSNAIRAVFVVASPQMSNDFFQSDIYNAFILLSYQVLLICLTFGLVFMVNRRLLVGVMTQEEKFNKVFQSSLYGIVISRYADEIILDVNRGFEEITGYLAAEAVGKTTLDLNVWVNEMDYPHVVEEITTRGEVRNHEFQFRTKSGRLVDGLFFAEILVIENEKLVLAGISDITESKHAEEIRRKSEERYRSLFDNMLNGFAYCQMIFDGEKPQDFIYLDVNRAFEPLTGLKEVIGKRASEVIPGIRERDPGVIETYGRVALTGRSESFEVYVEAMNMWFSISVYSPEKGFFVAVFDVITERKLAEENLRQDKARLHLALDAAKGGAWEWNLLTNENIWSEELWKVYGLEPYSCEPSYEVWLQTIHPEDRAGASLAVQKAAEEAKPLNAEWRVVDSDGRERWLMSRGQPIFNDHGQATRYIGTVLDITERKRAEEEFQKLNADLEQRVRERTAELNDLYNNAPCGYHSLDRNGAFIHINDTELTWLGYTREELTGKIRVLDIITPESRVVFEHKFPILKSEGWIKDVKLDFIRKDGTILPLLISATAIRDKDGNYHSSRTTLIDYSSLNQAEEAIRQSNQKLETVNKELEAFAYSVSHDLRAPLRGIDGWSLALLEDYHDLLDNQGQIYIERVRSEAGRMAQLIEDLLHLSRVTRVEMQIVPVDLSKLAHTIVARLMAESPTRQVEIVIQPGLEASGDAALLSVVLTNLLDNAWKFTGKREPACIEFGRTAVDGETAYFVRDNGAGFDMKYAQKLFGAFQRLHKSSEFPGTGVGLATVQRIINRHGGRVWVEAQVDGGATFFFTLAESV